MERARQRRKEENLNRKQKTPSLGFPQRVERQIKGTAQKSISA